jgi:ergothioneine biosynthesis protein EgtB
MNQSQLKQETNQLLNSFIDIREASLTIAAPLSEQDMQIQSMPDASPIKWHLAHTSWAFETFVLKPFVKNYQAFDDSFEYLFNSYYNAVGKQFPRTQRGQLSRPSQKTVFSYRKYVDQQIILLLSDQKSNQNHELNAIMQLMNNHEQQHQELMLTDIKHALFINPTYPAYSVTKDKKQPLYDVSNQQWVNFESGLYSIGHQNESFYFDNEGPPHQVFLQKFKLASRLITCGEYIQFIEEGGYQDSSLWLSEAWYKIQQDNILSPIYWIKKDHQWFHFTHNGLEKMDANSPVMHLNYFEANAYANSVDKRLPTEQEWEVASRSTTASVSTSNNKLQQMFGELWQWTSSSYNAYPGFKVANGAIGEYNGKFMVNQYVLRGGSIATPKRHIRASYRNFFYPGASWQYTGIRLAESVSE